MQILVASVDATPLQLTGDNDSVVITVEILRRSARLPVRQLCCVKHAHVSQILLGSLYVDRVDSHIVLHISTYVISSSKDQIRLTADPV
jgi:hypothetical protein